MATLARILLAISVACMLQARTLVVAPSGQFADVREAIREAAANDTIEVRGGTYDGNLILDKPVVLEGVGWPVLRGTGKGSVVTVLATGCSIRRFRIERSGAMLVEEDSGILLKSDSNHVEHNQLRDVLFGIYFFQSNHNTVADNLIFGRKELGFGERGAGIHIWNCAGNTIAGNTITDMRDGMYLQNADRSVIRGNRVFGVRYGLHYMYSNDNIFEDNVFEDNVAGAAIMYSHNIQFRRNAFVHNRGFSSFGVLFQDSDHCVSEQNLFVDNVVGIFMEALRDSRFERNLIASNDTAIEAFSSAERNDFFRNNFVANLSPISIVGKASNIRWDRDGAGNYWSDYKGYDLDANGVGDVAFRIQNLFEHLEGKRPRLGIYFFSPASQALAAGEQSFPVIGRALASPATMPAAAPQAAGHRCRSIRNPSTQVGFGPECSKQVCIASSRLSASSTAKP
jgi:nitrous oxidase accessory protein